MNRKLFASLFLIPAAGVAMADSTAVIDGSEMRVIEITPETSTGLNNIFVIKDASGCRLSFKVSDGYKAVVSRYSNLGGGYAQEIENAERSTSAITVELPDSDYGYILEDGTKRYYCWVTNYANHPMTLQGVMVSDQQDCSYSVLNIEGEASPIYYYTINGQQRTLSRDIYVDYNTQEYSEEINDFRTVDARKVYESLSHTLSITPPAYCSTYFTVSGDRFLREWNEELTAESGITAPAGVDCHTEAEQEEIDSDEPSNILKGDENGLGGSAPATVYFTAATTEGVAHFEWQMGRDQEFNNPEYRFYQKDLDYTFTQEGTYYLRFVGSNYDGTCETFGDTYTVTIGTSALECPNAFSPNGDGVNDLWKVSYRSLIDFHCEIFNRSGQKIFSFDNPSEGWDGTWHGKTVKSGVYYYVITAKGADGKNYKKSGDINIIHSLHRGSSTVTSPENFE